MPVERLETYVELARTIVPMFATLRHPDDPSDDVLMAAILDGAKPLYELQGPLQRYAMRQLRSGGTAGRPAHVHRDLAIRYFVTAFVRLGMTKREAIDTIRDLLPVTLSYEAVKTVLQNG